ncbi:MAG: DAHP synthetase [Olpidium bornovanus]|uniref:Phospho-2-dehydro-3-deoxyheptonate aldolase n=1 Tax=Olpidium bornovanus TaxID=278681 RepID=A0A8H8DJ66_9FUNG|nr:MAG: DAHP synthetase [Olpidium bornovanus]
MKTIGADSGYEAQTLRSVDLFMSHEGLHLEYESALTRLLPSGTGSGESAWYNIGTHFLWIGDRTRELDGAHVEYFSGIENPIGIKCGPTMRAEDLGPLLDKLNPKREVGKCTLITRYGVNNVEKHLPDHIAAVQRSGHIVVWACDPMHGK